MRALRLCSDVGGHATAAAAGPDQPSLGAGAEVLTWWFVRFAVHSPQAVGAIKIDWDAPVELTPAVRGAMAPHDVDAMHAGVVRRGFVVGAVTYPRGSIAFRVGDGHELFLQLPFEVAPAVRVAEAPTEHDLVDEVAGDERHRVVVGDALAGGRIDVILAGVVPELSRAVAQRLIDDGHVTLGGQRVNKSNQRLRAGDVIEIVVPNASVS
jgi:hypothetical protein